MLASSAQASSAAETVIPPGANAGYVMKPAALTKVGASWTVPAVTCPTVDASVHLGLELADASSGRLATIGVDADCRDGDPSYAAWFRVSGSTRGRLHRVAAGDLMEASLSDGKYVSASLTDVTAGWGYGVSSTFQLQATHAAVLVSRRFGPSGLRPLADFGTIRFTGSRVNGHPIAGPVQRLVMEPPHRSPMVRTSPLRSPSGTFSVTWLRS